MNRSSTLARKNSRAIVLVIIINLILSGVLFHNLQNEIGNPNNSLSSPGSTSLSISPELENNPHGGSWLDTFSNLNGIEINQSLVINNGDVYLDENIIFSDDFESGLGKWMTYAGNPSLSTTQARSGIYSFIVNENIDSIYISLPNYCAAKVETWFYDDATDFTATSIMEIHDLTSPIMTGPNTYQNINTYSYRVGWSWFNTGVTRSTGWHKVLYIVNGSATKIYLDNIYITTTTQMTTFKNFYLGDIWTDSTYMVTYYDDAKIYRFYKNGTLISQPITLPTGMNWDSLLISKSESTNTYINISILNATNNNPIPGFQDLCGNGELDISALNSSMYPKLKLQAIFESDYFFTPKLHYWGVSWNATNAWRDTFFKGPKVGSSENMFAYEGEIQLSTNPVQQQSSPSYYNIGNLNSTPVTLPPNYSWDTLIFNKTEPANTSLTITIYDNSTNIAIMGYTNLNQSFIDLSGLDPTNYPVIKLVAKFNSANGANTPVLYDGSVNWTYANEKPIANAGPSQTVFESQQITFNGSCSSDPDGSIVNWSWDIDADGVYDLFGPVVYYTYNDDSLNNVTLIVTDDQGASDTDYLMITVLNLNSTIDDFNITTLQAYPRTIGYWKHQCKIASPKGDHTGIKPEYITGINSNSSVFTTLSTKDDILIILEPDDSSNMTAKAEQQLMGLWLNVVSGKLSKGTAINLTDLTNATTVGAAITEIEQIILNSNSNRSELERAKDIADSINNGLGIITTVNIDIYGSDPGSDDITLTIDWNDGTANTTIIFYNNDPVNTSDPYPSQYIGKVPMTFHAAVNHNYSTPGTYLLTIMFQDDDWGSGLIRTSILI